MLKAPERRFVPPHSLLIIGCFAASEGVLNPVRESRIEDAHSGRALFHILGSGDAKA